jgi:uncharacterized protein YecE (DUF72 family)
MPISIGCAVWSYPGWVGEVYPPKTPSKEYLSVYSHHFPAVEGNTTFYAIPDRATIDRWIAQTPPGFKFCLKFPRAITHNGLLEPYLMAAQASIAQMQTLGDRLGVLFIQLPPNYAPSERFADLAAFLTGLTCRNVSNSLLSVLSCLAFHVGEPDGREPLSRSMPEETSGSRAAAPAIALEVRHLDWFKSPHREQLNELLHQLGIGRVILDSRPIYEATTDEKIAFECKKPRVPIELSLTAPFSLIRYVSHPILSANQVWLAGWTSQLQSWLQQDTQIYMFVHCPIEARSPINARYLHEIFTQSGIVLQPLPPRFVDDTPVQLKLF